MIYVYPKFKARLDIGIRISGMGLANCLFIFARAIVIAHKTNAKLINPTWEQLNFGTYLRREHDKRHYQGLFQVVGVRGLKKYYLINTLPTINENTVKKLSALSTEKPLLIKVEGLQNYYQAFIEDRILVTNKILSSINTTLLQSLNEQCFSQTIGIHIRLGDYHASAKAALSWYAILLQKIDKITLQRFKFLVFSDGSTDELAPILCLNIDIERVYFGTSIADLVALSACSLIVGSNSTFSGWASFIGNKPLLIPPIKGYLNDFSGLDYHIIEDTSRLTQPILDRLSTLT
jgi:hypothetical protein